MRHSPILEDILQGRELTDAWWEQHIEEASMNLQAEMTSRLGRNGRARYLRNRELFWLPISKKLILIWCQYARKRDPYRKSLNVHRDIAQHDKAVAPLEQEYQAQARVIWRKYLEDSIKLFRSILEESDG